MKRITNNFEWTLVRRGRCSRRPCLATGFCLILLLSVLFIIFLNSLRAEIFKCLPTNFNRSVTGRQVRWRYQNSITGQWYNWYPTYQKSPENVKWRVKWLNQEPKSSLGVIIYLATRNEIHALNQSLIQLSRLLVKIPRPVVIFHEGDFTDAEVQQTLARTVGLQTPLAFERIDFAYQSEKSRSIFYHHSPGYASMCRFYALMLPTHPLLSLFTYFWRLDTHSYIFFSGPIDDPFERLARQRIQYAFIMTNQEGSNYAVGLWSAFHKFLRHNCLKPSQAVIELQTNWFGWYSLDIIFTNFAIANVSLWRDHRWIQAWLQTVDRHGGIEANRWGDAPVHTLALTQFLERNEIIRLRYFGYWHRREYVCASGIDAKDCSNLVQEFRVDPKINYLHYIDGCFLPHRPLCHYYPEMLV